MGLRVLVLTNQLTDFCGSELVALEVATWFDERHDRVTLAANHVSERLRAVIPTSFAVTEAIEELTLESFDLVWCHHDLLSLLPLSAFDAAARSESLPLVAFVSLSPYEPYESVDPEVAHALSAEVFANSGETLRALVSRGHGLLCEESIRIFHNAAPVRFWSARRSAPLPAALSSLALVSHHAPAELDAVVARLESAGVSIWRIGQAHDYRRVEPGDLLRVDAVLSIGKTAVYALATETPVYLYDRFGGDGWLTEESFDANADFNFSGRPALRRLAPEELAREILDGFPRAAEGIRAITRGRDLAGFRLDSHLEPLRRRALARPGRAAALTRLSESLSAPRFRAHLEGSRAKHQVMRRAYRTQQGL